MKLQTGMLCSEPAYCPWCAAPIVLKKNAEGAFVALYCGATHCKFELLASQAD